MQELPKYDFKKEMLACEPALQKLALRLERNREDAKDLVQEVFIRAWKYQHTKDERPMLFWLKSITINEYCSRYKSNQRNPIHQAKELSDYDIEEGFEMNIAFNRNERVDGCVKRLPKKYRKVAELLMAENNVEEIIEKMNKKRSSVYAAIRNTEDLLYKCVKCEDF